MRDVGSKSIAGPEAILCAAVDWWLSGFDLQKVVLVGLGTSDPDRFWSKRPEDLAAAVSGVRWDRVVGRFWEAASGDASVRHMVEFAVRAWRPTTEAGRVAEAKAFVSATIMREAGDVVRSSGFLEENASRISAARASRGRR